MHRALRGCGADCLPGDRTGASRQNHSSRSLFRLLAALKSQTLIRWWVSAKYLEARRCIWYSWRWTKCSQSIFRSGGGGSTLHRARVTQKWQKNDAWTNSKRWAKAATQIIHFVCTCSGFYSCRRHKLWRIPAALDTFPARTFLFTFVLQPVPNVTCEQFMRILNFSSSRFFMFLWLPYILELIKNSSITINLNSIITQEAVKYEGPFSVFLQPIKRTC